MKYKDYPILALEEIPDDNSEYVYAFTNDGNYLIDDLSIHDLFFAPEKHEGWVNLYKWANKDCAYYIGSMYNSKAEAENKRDTSDNYVTTIKIELEE